MTVQRWTDEMLDELASSVSEVKNSVVELREGLSEVRESVTELRESVSEVRDSVDGLRVTTQALLQIASQHQQRMDRFDEEMELTKRRQAESDERFNILLEEVRYLIRGNQKPQDE